MYIIVYVAHTIINVHSMSVQLIDVINWLAGPW